MARYDRFKRVKEKMRLKRLLLLCLFAGSVSAINYQERFLQANEYYKEGEFSKAFELYSSIPNKSSVVLYNLGNCAYKQEKFGLALAYWKRSEKLWGPWNRDELLENISLVRKKIQHHRVSGITAYFKDLKNKTFSLIIAIPIIALQLGFLALWLFLFLYIRYLYRKKHKILIVFLFLLIALFGTMLAIKYSLECRRSGVIIDPNTVVLSGPGNNFSIIGNIPEVLEVVIKKELDDYFKVKFSGGSGWVRKKSVEEV